MGISDLLDWLDNSNPEWRDCKFHNLDDDLAEEMLAQFLVKHPDWLCDICPPVIETFQYEWVMNLWRTDGPDIKRTKWAIFGYCQQPMVDWLIKREEQELFYAEY